MRILIADDDDTVREALAAFLRDDPMVSSVSTAASRTSVVAVMRADGPFDFALLDEAIAAMNDPVGLAEVTGANRGRPVLILSRTPSDATRRQALAVGAAGLVSKAQGAASMMRVMGAFADIGPRSAAHRPNPG